jgi:hypothetical protein
MAHKGRPRKKPVTLAGTQPAAQLAACYPGGKRKPLHMQPTGTPQAKIRRAIDLALHGAADPTLATALGWLRLHGHLTDTQVAAGVAYARLKGQADRAAGMPSRYAASPNYELGYRAPTAVADDLDRGTRTVKRCETLRSSIQPKVLAILDAVVLDDRQPAAWEKPTLIAALEFVGIALGLTTARK